MPSLTEASMKIRIFKNSVLWLGAAFCLFSAAWAAEVIESRWAADPPRVDGQAAEWGADVMSSQKNLGVDLAFKNDAHNLYVLVLFKNPRYLSTMEITGITLYLSPAGKKQKDFGVRFRRKNATAEELIGSLDKQGQVLTEEKKAEIKAKPGYTLFDAEAVNKKGEVIPSPVAGDKVDLATFRMSRSAEDFVVYELRMPLASRDVYAAAVGSGPGELIKVGFEWGGMSKKLWTAMRAGGEMSEESEVSGGEAGGEGEEDESPAPNPSMGGSVQGPKKYSFWVDLKLAQVPTQ
jgi:hypothetical protein